MFDNMGNQQYPGYKWDGFQGWVPEKGMAASDTSAQNAGGQGGGSPLDALAALFALGNQSGWQANAPAAAPAAPGANPAAAAAVAAAAQPTANNLPSPMAPGARLPSPAQRVPPEAAAMAAGDSVPLPPMRPEGLGNVPLPPERPRTFADTRGWKDPGAAENAANAAPPVAIVATPPRRPEAIIAVPPRGADPGAMENYYRGNGLTIGDLLNGARRRGR